MKHSILPFVLALVLVGCSSPTSSEQKTVTHTVTFDSTGGTAVTSRIVNDGSKATKPADPTNGVHNFLGWYNGSTAFDFNTAVTADLTLTAKWTSTVTVEDTVRYDSTNTFTLSSYTFTTVGYSVFDLNTKTFTNYKVSQNNDTSNPTGNQPGGTPTTTYADKTVYIGGTFTWTGTTLTLTITVNPSSLPITGDTVYSTAGASWTWLSGNVMSGFGKSGYATTTVTKTVLTSHTEEK